MKKLLLIIVLSLSLINSSQADDISSFEISGISIGDSLLKHYKKNKILNSINQTDYKSDKFTMVTMLAADEIYEILQFHFKKNDNNYIIHSISGQKSMSIESCLPERDKIFNQLKSLFKNTETIVLKKREHPGYKNSYSYSNYFQFENGDLIEIACYDYNDELNQTWADKLTISLDTKEFNKFLMTAY